MNTMTEPDTSADNGLHLISVSVEKAMQLTGISRRELYRQIQKGNLAKRKLGKRTLIPYQGLLSFIQGLPTE